MTLSAEDKALATLRIKAEAHDEIVKDIDEFYAEHSGEELRRFGLREVVAVLAILDLAQGRIEKL